MTRPDTRERMLHDTRSAPEVERLTHDYGREIFARIGHDGPLPLSPGWWDERLMDWTMADEAIKVQLFRFIDVLPLLHSPQAINRHLLEYFQELGPRSPIWLRLGLGLLSRNGVVGRLVARTARGNAERLARRFIAGSNLDEAIDSIGRLRRRTLAPSICWARQRSPRLKQTITKLNTWR